MQSCVAIGVMDIDEHFQWGDVIEDFIQILFVDRFLLEYGEETDLHRSCGWAWLLNYVFIRPLLRADLVIWLELLELKGALLPMLLSSTSCHTLSLSEEHLSSIDLSIIFQFALTLVTARWLTSKLPNSI